MHVILTNSMFLFGETTSILLWDETYDESCYFNVHEFDPLYHEKYIEIKFKSFRYTVVTLPSSHALADLQSSKHN